MADWITPYRIPHHQCLSIGQAPSQGLVYAVNEDIVVKIPFQYRVTDNKDCEAEVLYIETTVCEALNFCAKKPEYIDF